MQIPISTDSVWPDICPVTGRFAKVFIVIWLFDRNGKKLKYEICKDNNKGEGYMLVLTSSDGDKQVERVDQPSVLIEQSIVRMRQLRSDGWKIG